jgi:hypothetical protein
MYKRFLIIAVIAVLATGSCRRSGTDPQSSRLSGVNCERLKNAMINHDVDEARVAITEFIANLYSDLHTEANVNELVRLIENSCGTIDAALFCFACIDTLPPQTEIILRLKIGGQTIVKVIDLSYTPANRLKFVSMHN